MWKQVGKKMWKLSPEQLHIENSQNNNIIKSNRNKPNTKDQCKNNTGKVTTDKHIHFNDDEIKEWDKFRGTFTKIQEPKTPQADPGDEEDLM